MLSFCQALAILQGAAMFFLRFLALIVIWLFCLAAGNGNNGIAKLCTFLFFPLSIFIYMLPTYEAWKLKNENIMPVAILNVFLGWSIVGWAIALSWAYKKPQS